MEPESPTRQADSLLSEPVGKPQVRGERIPNISRGAILLSPESPSCGTLQKLEALGKTESSVLMDTSARLLGILRKLPYVTVFLFPGN